jgi:hypothetical protein
MIEKIVIRFIEISAISVITYAFIRSVIDAL